MQTLARLNARLDPDELFTLVFMNFPTTFTSDLSSVSGNHTATSVPMGNKRASGLPIQSGSVVQRRVPVEPQSGRTVRGW